MTFYFLTYAYEKNLKADIGGFRKLWELADRLQKKGHRVRVFFPDLPTYSPLKSLPYTSYPLLNLSFLRSLTAYFSMCFYGLIQGFRERPDVVYFRNLPNILPLILGKCLGARVVLEVNASVRDFHKTVKVSPFRRFVFSVSERFNATFSDKIIVLTSGQKKALAREYKLPGQKIEVIPSGTDTEHFFPRDSQEAKREIGVDPGRPVVGFVGIFYPHQGVDTLIYAAKDILKAYPDALFLVVGKGIMEKPWKDLTRSEGASGSFLFTGQVPYEKVPLYFNSIDISVAPLSSKIAETSSFKILDALACGKAVVASGVASINLLAQEFNGAIVTVTPDEPAALAKAVIDLLSDESRRKALTKNARKIVRERYSWEAIANQVLGFLSNGISD